jgi:two-component system alkaline phosphatase synthesis response regulator PhoP
MAQNDASDYKILLVDDEPDILEFLTYNLEKEGYQVFTAKDGVEAVRKAQEIVPHLIVLDIMMPNMDGIEACTEINKIPALDKTIKIFLSARSEDYSQIAGFDAGADDYVTKPIKPKVFVSKVNALLRRVVKANTSPDSSSQGIHTFKNLTIDTERYMVTRHGEEFVLPRKEFELLRLLTSKPGKVFTREEILSSVWGNDVVVGDRTIDVHIRKLRDKLKLNRIKTIKGVGYKFNDKE